MGRPTQAAISRLAARIDVPDWQHDPTSRKQREITEAFSGEPLGMVPVGTETDVQQAFERARVAQRDWAARTPAERAEVLRRFAELVHTHRERLLDLVQAESGKNRSSAVDELVDVMLTASFYAEKGPDWLRNRAVPGSIPVLSKALVQHVPRGVVGIIAPWNYPLTLSVSDGIAAIMAGCAVVIKPDSQTPFTCLAAVQLLDEAGMPNDLWQVVPGTGSMVGKAITENCDYLMFTGSSTTGAKLGEQAGARLIGYSAELGGKNPMIVGNGVDLEWVAEIATRACFASGGQLCISMERIYVEQDSYAEFCETFAARTKAMPIGPSYGWDTEIGCLISTDQLAKVREHIEDAVAKGARVIAGGSARPDLGPTFHEPTVLVDVPADAQCYREETFGPVVAIYPVDSLDEAVERANDSSYGLNSAVFCADDETAMDVALRLKTGMCNINEGFGPAWSALAGPSGGMGRSGVGYRHGKEGLLKYTHARTIATQSRLMHLGGPSVLPREAWPVLLEHASRLLTKLPGR